MHTRARSPAGGPGPALERAFDPRRDQASIEIALWDYDRLDELCKAAGIQLSGSYDELVGAFQLNRRVPGTTRWGQQLLLGLGVVVCIVAFVALLIGPGTR